MLWGKHRALGGVEKGVIAPRELIPAIREYCLFIAPSPRGNTDDVRYLYRRGGLRNLARFSVDSHFVYNFGAGKKQQRPPRDGATKPVCGSFLTEKSEMMLISKKLLLYNRSDDNF